MLELRWKRLALVRWEPSGCLSRADRCWRAACSRDLSRRLRWAGEASPLESTLVAEVETLGERDGLHGRGGSWQRSQSRCRACRCRCCWRGCGDRGCGCGCDGRCPAQRGNRASRRVNTPAGGAPGCRAALGSAGGGHGCRRPWGATVAVAACYGGPASASGPVLPGANARLSIGAAWNGPSRVSESQPRFSTSVVLIDALRRRAPEDVSRVFGHDALLSRRSSVPRRDEHRRPGRQGRVIVVYTCRRCESGSFMRPQKKIPAARLCWTSTLDRDWARILKRLAPGLSPDSGWRRGLAEMSPGPPGIPNQILAGDADRVSRWHGRVGLLPSGWFRAVASSQPATASRRDGRG